MGYSYVPKLPANDKRLPKFAAQRAERGWDDTETWSLCTTIAHFALPRLKRFKEVNNGHPMGLTEDEWDRELDEMIFAMEKASEDSGIWDWDEPTADRVQRGLELFGSKFLHLWW